MKDEHKELSLWEALAVMQNRAPVIRKTETVSVETKAGGRMTYNFAGLAKVWEAISGLLEELGFVYSSRADVMDLGGGQTRFVLRCTLFHIPSGEKLEGMYPLSGDSPQKIGSTITFGRRYWLVAALNLIVAEDDDDAQAAEEHSQLSPSQQAQAGRPTARRAASRAPARARQAPPPTDGPKAAGMGMSQRVQGQFFAVLGELGLTDRDAIMEYVNETLAQHDHGPVQSRTELSDETAGWVIERARRADAGPEEG